VALLVVTGDRGLCGGYNTNVIRRAEQRMNELKEQGINYQLVIADESGTVFRAPECSHCR
jgi:F-type H+-transporting ATPase subunit gamma